MYPMFVLYLFAACYRNLFLIFFRTVRVWSLPEKRMKHVLRKHSDEIEVTIILIMSIDIFVTISCLI